MVHRKGKGEEQEVNDGTAKGGKEVGAAGQMRRKGRRGRMARREKRRYEVRNREEMGGKRTR